ncbi:MAG TPA: hypothetical protein VIH28_10770 [Ignavibacteriaceae bacterium]
MKIDKRIILYLDNQMNDEERKSFEDELSKSSELSNQFQHYKNVLQSLKVNEQRFTNEDYFINLVPKFRETILVNKKSFKIKTAFALTAVASAAIVLLFFNPFQTSENNSADKIISTLNETEAVEILDYYSNGLSTINNEQLNGYSDSLFSDLIYSELNLEETDINRVVSAEEISIENIYSEIKPEEADIIYNEILNKKFF